MRASTPARSRDVRCGEARHEPVPAHRCYRRSRRSETGMTRTLPPAARPTVAPEALILPPGATLAGRATSRGPLRREGPAKLTGLTKYADDLVFPGAWYGATIRSTEPHARLLRIDLDEAYDWTKVVVVTAADIPR